MTPILTLDVHRLRGFVRGLTDFQVQPRNGACYAHIGATICDTVLQAGLNYRTVVAPRVQRVICRWPSATRSSRFLAMISRHGLNDVLLWKHPEKPTRIGQFTEFLVGQRIETEDELSEWLTDDENSQSLRELRGVGPKTVDYLKSLVGLPAVAVDRHVRTFAAWAGVTATSYDHIRQIVCEVADSLQLERRAFDHAIWSYVSTLQNLPRSTRAA